MRMRRIHKTRLLGFDSCAVCISLRKRIDSCCTGCNSVKCLFLEIDRLESLNVVAVDLDFELPLFKQWR